MNGFQKVVFESNDYGDQKCCDFFHVVLHHICAHFFLFNKETFKCGLSSHDQNFLSNCCLHHVHGEEKDAFGSKCQDENLQWNIK